MNLYLKIISLLLNVRLKLFFQFIEFIGSAVEGVGQDGKIWNTSQTTPET